MDNFLGFALYFTYFLFAITALAAIAFPIIQIAKDPKEAKVTLFGILGICVIFIVSYFLSTGQIVVDAELNMIADAGTSKLVGAGITTLYIFFVVALVSMIYTEVTHLIKR